MLEDTSANLIIFSIVFDDVVRGLHCQSQVIGSPPPCHKRRLTFHSERSPVKLPISLASFAVKEKREEEAGGRGRARRDEKEERSST